MASSQPFQLNIDGLSKDLKISRETFYLYIEYLEKAGVFNLLYAGSSGKKIVRKPMKIYLENTNLVQLIHHKTGFDYEIGGKSKKAKQLDLSKGEFLVKDNIEIGSPHAIPLWLFGMMY